jgi:5-hydroxyisourate hydrolase-like protein (transthyretin family)
VFYGGAFQTVAHVPLVVHERSTGGKQKNLEIIFIVFEIKNVNFTTKVVLIVLQYLYSVYQGTILFLCSNINTDSPLSSNGTE